eukprot:1176234-Prorocentrum_minimum.AAC.4
MVSRVSTGSGKLPLRRHLVIDHLPARAECAVFRLRVGADFAVLSPGSPGESESLVLALPSRLIIPLINPSNPVVGLLDTQHASHAIQVVA